MYKLLPKKLIFLIFTLIFLIIPASALAATLSLSPTSGNVNRSCEFIVDVNLDTTGANTDGTDVILKYNPSQLTVTSVDQGDVYPDYPSISPNNSNGTILVSGIASKDEPFTGTGKFATIHFSVTSTAAVGSSAAVNFDFDPANTQKTTDTNVVESGSVREVLSSVTNGSYTIGSGTCGAVTFPSTGLPKGGGTVPTPAPNLDDITGGGTPPGIASTTFIIFAVGILMVILGLAGSLLL